MYGLCRWEVDKALLQKSIKINCSGPFAALQVEMLQVNKQTIPANSSMWLVTFTHASLSQTVIYPVNHPSSGSSLSHTSYNSHRTTMTKPKPLQLKEIKRLAICLESDHPGTPCAHFPQVHHKTLHFSMQQKSICCQRRNKPINSFSLHPIESPSLGISSF